MWSKYILSTHASNGFCLEYTEKGLTALQLQGLFSILYEQRGWEKFFTVKQRGKCLLVINFTPLIYHMQTPYHNILVCYFTILSNPIHEDLDASIYLEYKVIRSD